MHISIRGEFLIDGRCRSLETREGLLLAALCVRPGMRARRDALAQALWPEANRKNALTSLRQTILRCARIVPVSCDRTHIWLENVSCDYAEFEVWTPILPDWRHPEIESIRERDRNVHSDAILKSAAMIDDPIEKVASMKEALSVHPLDEDICADLLALYRDLGWRTEATLLVRAIERFADKQGGRVFSRKLQTLLRPMQSDFRSNRHGLSKQQNIELTLAAFPVQFSTGQFIEAQHSLEALLIEGGLAPEQVSRIGFYLARIHMYTGRVRSAKQAAEEWIGASDSPYDSVLRAYNFYICDRFDDAFQLLLRVMSREDVPDDLFCDAMSLLVGAAKLVNRPDIAATALEAGFCRAKLSGSKYSEVGLKGMELWMLRQQTKSSDISVRLRELIQETKEWEFRYLEAAFRADLGKSQRESGELREAELTLQRCVAFCDTHHLSGRLGIALDYLGETYLSMKKYADAALTFQRSVLLRRETGQEGALCTGYRGAGLALLGLGEYGMAEEMFKRCLPIYKKLDHEMQYGVCCLYLALALESKNPRLASSSWQEGVRAIVNSGAEAAWIRYEVGDEMWDKVAPDLMNAPALAGPEAQVSPIDSPSQSRRG